MKCGRKAKSCLVAPTCENEFSKVLFIKDHHRSFLYRKLPATETIEYGRFSRLASSALSKFIIRLYFSVPKHVFFIKIHLNLILFIFFCKSFVFAQ